jgi:hypothetical protein
LEVRKERTRENNLREEKQSAAGADADSPAGVGGRVVTTSGGARLFSCGWPTWKSGDASVPDRRPVNGTPTLCMGRPECPMSGVDPVYGRRYGGRVRQAGFERSHPNGAPMRTVLVVSYKVAVACLPARSRLKSCQLSAVCTNI